MEKTNIDKIESRCHAIKLKILELAKNTGKNGAHIGGAFSTIEIISSILALSDFSNKADRDKLILSKGHGALALYGALWQYGYMSEDVLSGFDRNNTGLFGHPHKNSEWRIDFSAGSLGLGVSYSIGISLGLKKKNSNRKVYTIVGDGECNEGIVWEAFMSASNLNLSNLVVIIDCNGWQSDGPTHEVMKNGNLVEKLSSFGFAVQEIDGHEISQIIEAIENTYGSVTPCAIVANTVKANGISFLMNTKESHFCPMPDKKYQQAVEDINAYYDNGK